MDTLRQNFLLILKAALNGEQAEALEFCSEDDWNALIRLAETHHVLPMFYEAVYGLPVLERLNPAIRSAAKQKAIHQVMLQTMKTDAFLRLNQHLQSAGIRPLVVKGIICRNLYPEPDHRQSSDEDLLILPEQLSVCHEAMQSFGMRTAEPDLEAAYEIPYTKQGSPLYIELHKYLFPPESEAYGDLNRYFNAVFERAVQENIQGVPVFTLGYTDHLLYLICHAFKHFLHSGFGIRQVCDIVLYANAYGGSIDWLGILERCKEIHAGLFTAAIFKIGQRYLNFDPEKACYPAEWRRIQVDETAMLEDLLSGGIYGAANMNRKHSSNMTLDAVTAQKQGRNVKNTVFSSLFPAAKKLESRYGYLKTHPYLLPVAWIDRILKYRKETKRGTGNSAAEAIEIGSRRIELLKQYGIIDGRKG